MSRYFKAFIVAILFYTALIASVVYVINHNVENKSAKKSLQRVKVTLLTMCKPKATKNNEPKAEPTQEPEVEPTQEQEIEQKPEPTPQLKVEPKQELKPKIEPKVQVKPIKPKIEPKPKPKPKPTPKKEKKPKPKKKLKPKKKAKIKPKHKTKAKIKPKKRASKKVKKAAKSAKRGSKKAQKSISKSQRKKTLSNNNFGVNRVTSKITNRQKQNYYALVKRTIAQNKIYPRVAARRGMQGSVRVNFTLSPNGDLLNINIISGPQIFYNSVRSAIQNSFPLRPPPNLFRSNINMTITIVYKIR